MVKGKVVSVCNDDNMEEHKKRGGKYPRIPDGCER